MKSLPKSVTTYKKTSIFNERTVPKGLLKEHNTTENVWGVINITSGKLEYHITETGEDKILLTPSQPGIVEPQVRHHIKPVGSVSFYIEFYR